MPLTVRTNGSAGSNIITAQWFNDFLNLFTGQMQDQEVTFQNVLILKAIGAAPSAAATAALAAGTTLGIGLYVYAYTYANNDGESTISPTTSITTTSGNQKVNLSAVTVGPTGTTKRNIYRTAVGGGTNYKFVGSINDNVTTTFSDTVADGSLGAASPVFGTFGGTLIIQDQTGAVKGRVGNDGTNLVLQSAGANISFKSSGGQDFHTGPGFWLDSGSLNLIAGSINRINFGFASGITNAGTTVTHNLGTTTNVAAFCTINNFALSPVENCFIDTLTSTTFRLSTSGTTARNVWWIIVAH